jgi:type II secretory pathway predicted ATPase ExeA
MHRELEQELDRAIETEIRHRLEAGVDFTQEDIVRVVTAGYPELMKKLVRHHMDEASKRLQEKRGRGKKRNEPPRLH